MICLIETNLAHVCVVETFQPVPWNGSITANLWETHPEKSVIANIFKICVHKSLQTSISHTKIINLTLDYNLQIVHCSHIDFYMSFAKSLYGN